MNARSINGRSTGEIKTALEESMAGNFKPTLAFVFMSVKQNREEICELLNKQGISIFGATTSGEFISPEITAGGTSIMLLDIDPAHYEMLFRETAESSAYEVSKELGIEGRKIFSNPAFIIAAGWLHTDGEQIVAGIEEGIGANATIFGGIAGDDLALREPFVFTYGKSSTTGLVALIVDEDKVRIKGIATCGWKPIGITKTITKSIGNVVYTIDDKPALDLVIKYLGLTMDSESTASNTVVSLGAYYPLQLERENAPAVMRTTMFGNVEDRSLICAGNVPQGSKVRFSLPPDFDVIDTVVDECIELKQEDQPEADAVIIFSCISRYLSFGVLTSNEIERVQHVWNAPMAGFFCYGEFGRSKNGKHEFHNNTCCVVTLKEK
ncbi:MAG: FIST N-terminal domain-containing protein [Ferruginibacter sp.]